MGFRARTAGNIQSSKVQRKGWRAGINLVAVEALADVVGPRGAPRVAFHLLSLDLLKVGGLRQQEQLVDRLHVDVADPPEVDAHADVAEQEQRFFAGDEPRRAK